MVKSRHRALAELAGNGHLEASDVEWVVDRRRTVGAVWSGWQGAGSRLRRRGGETRAYLRRVSPLKGGSALVSSTDSTDVARATALARSAGGDSV